MMTYDELLKQFPYLGRLRQLAEQDIGTLFEKEAGYRGSWMQRGGIGAFMMLARKWDRIEAAVKGNCGYDIFKAIFQTQGDSESLIETIRDLRCYLLLVEAYTVDRMEGVTQIKVMPVQHNDALRGLVQGVHGRTEHPAPFGFDPVEEGIYAAAKE